MRRWSGCGDGTGQLQALTRTEGRPGISVSGQAEECVKAWPSLRRDALPTRIHGGKQECPPETGEKMNYTFFTRISALLARECGRAGVRLATGRAIEDAPKSLKPRTPPKPSDAAAMRIPLLASPRVTAPPLT